MDFISKIKRLYSSLEGIFENLMVFIPIKSDQSKFQNVIKAKGLNWNNILHTPSPKCPQVM